MTATLPPQIPTGNLEPAELERFVRNDFTAAWNAMATSPADPGVGGNFMFARQAFAYLELASRTASTDESSWYLQNFAVRLSECDRRYFTALPGTVPIPTTDELRLPLLANGQPERQLLAALFDTGRHGLSHLAQQMELPRFGGVRLLLS